MKECARCGVRFLPERDENLCGRCAVYDQPIRTSSYLSDMVRGTLYAAGVAVLFPPVFYAAVALTDSLTLMILLAALLGTVLPLAFLFGAERKPGVAIMAIALLLVLCALSGGTYLLFRHDLATYSPGDDLPLIPPLYLLWRVVWTVSTHDFEYALVWIMGILGWALLPLNLKNPRGWIRALKARLR